VTIAEVEKQKVLIVKGACCNRIFFIYLFIRVADVSYGRLMEMRCRLICQSIYRTVGDRRGEI